MHLQSRLLSWRAFSVFTQHLTIIRLVETKIIIYLTYFAFRSLEPHIALAEPRPCADTVVLTHRKTDRCGRHTNTTLYCNGQN